jgi:hypothetical protein
MTIECFHEILIKRLRSFLPMSSTLRILTMGQFTLQLNKTLFNVALCGDATKILLYTKLYERLNNEVTTNSLSSAPGHHYAMLTTMMNHNALLSRNGNVEHMSIYGGRFIYFKQVQVEILKQPIKALHVILESFILKWVWISVKSNEGIQKVGNNPRHSTWLYA